MITLVRIVIGVYFLAINVYSFMLLRFQKKSFEDGECQEKTVKDGSLFTAAMLGGALGVYVGMFVLKYRLKSLFLMVTMPVLTVINCYILITAFKNDFWMVREMAQSSPPTPSFVLLKFLLLHLKLH